MTRVLILTQYYPPETGAPQNRLHSLAKFLQAKGFEVEVVTAMPNYPGNQIFEAYKGNFSVRELIDSVKVVRTWIFVGKSRRLRSRLLNYFSFVITSFFKLLILRKANVIICESPPLFLGITAVVIRRLRKLYLVFNVSDLWPESAEKLGLVKNRFFLNVTYRLEAWIYKNAHMISGQTGGIVDSIRARFPEKMVYWMPNGVDLDFFRSASYSEDWRGTLNFSIDDFVLGYAGIMGFAQGLEILIKAAALLRDDDKIKFLFIGDGPEKNKLVKLAQSQGLTNVTFLPNLAKSRVPGIINMCDACIIPLRKLDLFKGAIPSKIFEPLALKKPILLGVDGEARRLFIDEAKAGLFFEPESALALTESIVQLRTHREAGHQFGINGYNYVCDKFDRQVIHDNFLSHLRLNGILNDQT